MKISPAMIRGGLFLALSCTGFPQTTDGPASFEVATIKRVDPGGSASGKFMSAIAGMASIRGGPGSDDPERISYSNARLKLILIRAYNLQRFQIFGPDWIDTDRFDIAAKVPRGATKEQLQSMLQNLLTERFQMKARRETKILPVFALVVQKTGHKLQAGEISGEPDLKFVNPDLKHSQPQAFYPRQIVCRNMTMADFAERLGVTIAPDYIDRKVVDDTGIAGAYSFGLQWFGSSVVGNAGGVTVFEALERQLGLKLESRKAPVETLVIDSLSRIPAEN